MSEIESMTNEELFRELFVIYHGTHFKLVLGGDVTEDNTQFQNILDEAKTRTQPSPIVQAMKENIHLVVRYEDKMLYYAQRFYIEQLDERNFWQCISFHDSESEAITALLA